MPRPHEALIRRLDAARPSAGRPSGTGRTPTAGADHEIAKRVRDLAGLNLPGGPGVDDITYSAPDGPSVFTHPLCPNTFRNRVFVGNEQPATGY